MAKTPERDSPRREATAALLAAGRHGLVLGQEQGLEMAMPNAALEPECSARRSSPVSAGAGALFAVDAEQLGAGHPRPALLPALLGHCCARVHSAGTEDRPARSRALRLCRSRALIPKTMSVSLGEHRRCGLEDGHGPRHGRRSATSSPITALLSRESLLRASYRLLPSHRQSVS